MNKATYVRLYADENGESHFEDVSTELVPTDFAPPADPLNVAPFLPASRTFWVGGPADWAGDTPHPTPRRQIFCCVKGGYVVTASDGEARTFGPGEVLLLEDTVGKGHSSTLTGDEGALVFAVAVD